MKKVNYIKHEIKNWWREQNLNSKELTARETKIFKELKLKGFAVVKGFWTAADCERFRSEMDQAIDKYFEQCWKDEHQADCRLYGGEVILPKAASFWKHKALRKLAKAYGNLDPIQGFTMLNRIRFKEENKGSGGGWHRDTSTMRQFKSILYLSDVGEANGPFEYLPGTHTTKSLVMTEWKAKLSMHQHRFTPEEIDKVSVEKVTFTGSAGDLILVDTRGIHRGKPLSEGERYAMTNYYLPSVSQKFQDLLVKENA